MNLKLHITLMSDTTFGRGDGVAGLVDQEVEHDTATGLPFLRGRTLRGLLVEECANIVAVLPETVQPTFDQAAKHLFGTPGSGLDTAGSLIVGAAKLPETVRDAVTDAVEAKQIHPTAVLDSLTDIRRQTAVAENGAPDEGSLRAMRVILRQTKFVADLHFTPSGKQDEDEQALALLAASVMALRRAGTGRNRGRGRLQACLQSEAYMADHFAQFQKMVAGGTA